jgi:hypothetical protein
LEVLRFYVLDPSSDYRPPNRLSPIPSPTPMSFENCPRLICQEYIRSLNLPHAYFQSSHDKCFCPVDYPDTRPRIKKSGGYHYTVPCGWVRFALKTDQTLSRSQRIFQRWATSYYGTSENKIEEILENGFIPFPGDQLRNGTIFLVGFPGGRNDFCTSPSIEYISELHSGSRTRFLSHDGNTYEVQLILQCKQRPETFDIEPDESDWCDRIPNDTIVWKSNEQSTIVPCGVMVRARIFRQ